MDESNDKSETRVNEPLPTSSIPAMTLSNYTAAVVDESKNNGKATASLVLGIVGLIAWFIPLFGFPVTITGLVLGLIALKSSRRSYAIAGVTMCIIGLVLTSINIVLGVMIALSDGNVIKTVVYLSCR